MVSRKNQKIYTVVSFNESQNLLMSIQLTIVQLAKILPKYILGILVNGFSHPLSIGGKFRKYSLSFITIGSTNFVSIEINNDQFTKLFPAGSFKLLTKIHESVIEQVDKDPETSKETSNPNFSNGNWSSIKATATTYNAILPCTRISDVSCHYNYSLMFRPKKIIWRSRFGLRNVA